MAAIWRLPARTQQPFKGAVTEAYVPPPAPTTKNTRPYHLGEWIGMARKMPIGTFMGALILVLLIAS